MSDKPTSGDFFGTHYIKNDGTGSYWFPSSIDCSNLEIDGFTKADEVRARDLFMRAIHRSRRDSNGEGFGE